MRNSWATLPPATISQSSDLSNSILPEQQHPVDAIGIATLLCVIIGVYLTIRQIKLATKQLEHGHIWNRIKAAEDICTQSLREPNLHKSLLTKHLKWHQRSNPITLTELREAIYRADNPEASEEDIASINFSKLEIEPKNEGYELIQSIHYILNYYESLARGIEEKVYDEKIIKRAHYGQMRRTLRILSEYMISRRKASSDHDFVWIDFENLVKKWNNDPETRAERTATGI